MPGPELRELVVKGTNKTVCHACSKCGAVFNPKPNHCPFCYHECVDCHVPMTTTTGRCDRCRKKHDQKREQAQFDKATKVTFEEYEGKMLYDDRSDRYFSDPDELFDYHHNDFGELPEWAWGTTVEEFKLDAEDIVMSALQDHHEDASDNISGLDFKRLQKYLDVWCRKQEINTYYQASDVVVLLDKEREAYMKENNIDEETG